jgi:hypothetical protein
MDSLCVESWTVGLVGHQGVDHCLGKLDRGARDISLLFTFG